jgi:hypothetical protein
MLVLPPVDPGESLLRINAGSSAPLLGKGGKVWSADAFFNTGFRFAADGISVDTSSDPRADVPALYSTERFHTLEVVPLPYAVLRPPLQILTHVNSIS